MKIRTDFVSNSSSSSFVLARKGGLNEKQKEAVIRYVEEHMMGKPLPPMEEGEDLDDYRERVDCWMTCDLEKLRRAQEEGMTLYGGYVVFECCDYNYANVFQNIWRIAEEADDTNFRQLDTDLSY